MERVSWEMRLMIIFMQAIMLTPVVGNSELAQNTPGGTRRVRFADLANFSNDESNDPVKFIPYLNLFVKNGKNSLIH